MANTQMGAVLQYVRQLGAAPNTTGPIDQQLLQDFSLRRDEAAFTALVQRHGSLVLGVCRSVLGCLEDAEDAFQSTFMVLVRKAASIRKGESLACWLHGVAYRMALQALRAAARRRVHERRVKTMTQRDPVEELTWREVQGLLQEEIHRLPRKYRDVFVLCWLNGTSRTDAARELGVREGTLSSRLAQARKLLQERLAHRGVGLSVLLTAVGLTPCATAVVPVRLVKATLRAALPSGMQTGAAGHPITSNNGATQSMFSSKLKVVMSVLLAGVIVAGAGVLAHRADAARQSVPQQKDEAKPKTASLAERADPERPKGTAPQPVKVRGRVLDAGGKPLAGARLYLGHYGAGGRVVFSVRATTGKDGRFDFSFDRAELGKARPDKPVGRLNRMFTLDMFDNSGAFEAVRVGQLAAVAAGHGYDWARVDKLAPGMS